jgi:hypothetical protein
MHITDPDRRRFLVAAVTFAAAAAGTFGPACLRLGRAWAQGGVGLDARTKDALVRVARLLYPHDGIADEVYAQVLDAALASTAGDGSFADTLREADGALNAQQDAPFIELDETRQLAALRAVEHRDFFSAVQSAVRIRFYNHPAVWERLGYGGPSFARGGYLNRGAGEIDWLEGAP